MNFIVISGIGAVAFLPYCGKNLVVEATQAGTTIKQVQSQIVDTQNQIDEINDRIDALLDEQSIVDEKIDDLNSEIINTMASLDMKEEELALKEEELASKEERLDEMRGEIADAEAEYEKAKEDQEKQYSDMLVRIRYMYENGSASVLDLMMQGEGLSDVLNRMDYMEKVYEYDRIKLQQYTDTTEQVQNLWNALVEEQSLLETEKLVLESDREKLEEDKRQMEAQQESLNSLLAQKKRESSNYDAEIKRAEQEAAVAAKLLKQEKNQLKKLQDEEAKSGSGNGTKNDAKTDNNGASNDTPNTTPTDTPWENGTDGGTGVTDPADAGTVNTGTSDTGGSSNASLNSDIASVINSASGSEKGKQIARYACQFVGNPYVSGGTSLTSGADCSGFVYRVYSDFGYSLPRTSYEQRSAGTAVDYSSAQPGDIICYDGHVALYLGGGRIVHASTVKTGIKYGTATYRPILSVRRIVQ